MLAKKLKLGSDVDNTSKDVLGGFSTLNSDIYSFEIKSAHLMQSAKGAVGVVLEVVTADGKTVKETLYVTTSTEKGGETHYVAKDGKKYPLPSYALMDDICLLTVNKELEDVASNVELKYVNVYNPDLKKEVPTEVEILTELTGQTILLGILKVVEEKRNAMGISDGTTRERNTIAKAFHAETKGTVTELQADNDSAGTFYDQWLEKNKDKVIDNTGKAKKGAAGSGKEEPKKKLSFGKKS